MSQLTDVLDLFSEILVYPRPDHLHRVDELIQALGGLDSEQRSDVISRVERYRAAIADLPLMDLEEDYVRTFDLNKSGTLDLGWHLFGEDYNRGLFLVKLRQLLQVHGVEEASELPDHVSHVLRILGRMDQPEEFAYSCVIPALETVAGSIADDNHYRFIIQGLLDLLGTLFQRPEGFEEEPEESEAGTVRLPVIQ